jgi:protein O-mannosyl-transferase
MRRPAAKPKPALRMATARVAAKPRLPVWLLAILLVLGTVALYWPAMRCDFITFDDPEYVTANPHVQGGLNWESVKWAFFNPVSANWHPLTVLSHMLDCQLFGLKPYGHHLVNVLWHALNVALIFALLRRLTGATWRSLLAAALWAVHPLRVESVAWVSERKDVLSTFFGLLTLICYTHYVEQFKIQNSKFKIFYGLTLLFFAFGLMSKPMLLTWPFVLLLLDYWPFKRISDFRSPISDWKLLLFEKIPFFVLVVADGVVTFMVQKRGGGMGTVEHLSLGTRVENALISYARYLGKMIWPTDLAVFYPRPGHWPVENVVLAGLLLCVISLVLFVQRQRYPFMLMGWLWFVGTLVPVIGLVQVGDQALADRYTYIPSLGLMILVVWGAYALIHRWRYNGVVLSVVGSAMVAVCMVVTHQQLRYWRDSEALFRHALAVTENNYLAHNNLGTALDEKGQTDEAINQYQEALRLKPDFVIAHYNLGTTLVEIGQTDGAISQYQEVLRLNPDFAKACNNLGYLWATRGENLDEAQAMIERAVKLEPKNAEFLDSLGLVLLKLTRPREALEYQLRAIEYVGKPDASLYDHLGDIYAALKLREQAGEAWRKSLSVEPNPEIEKKVADLSAR